MKKILLVFGTRPEAIKMAPIWHALKLEANSFEIKICVTGQHKQMLNQVLSTFNIFPDMDLDLMKSGQDLFDVTSSVMLAMRGILDSFRPDLVLVHGDTTSALAASIASFYAGISVGHVEAGLRTYDIHNPFPEEFNRQVITKIAKLHFAPTKLSKNNLILERVSDQAITVTGNTVIDALFWTLDCINVDSKRKSNIEHNLDQCLSFDWKSKKFILITGHRRENHGQGFVEICKALLALSSKYPDVYFVYPVHLNPRVQEPVNLYLAGIKNVVLTAPLDYENFIYLLKHCYIVLTDSGGIQEEAPSLGKPVLVMRGMTERPEAVEAGTVRLVGTSAEKIFNGISELLENNTDYERMTKIHNPYGDGQASKRIVSVIKSFLS